MKRFTMTCDVPEDMTRRELQGVLGSVAWTVGNTADDSGEGYSNRRWSITEVHPRAGAPTLELAQAGLARVRCMQDDVGTTRDIEFLERVLSELVFQNGGVVI